MKRLIDAYASLFEKRRSVVVAFVIVVTTIYTVSVLRLKTDDKLISALRVQDVVDTPEEKELVEQSEQICVITLDGDEIFSPTGVTVLRKLDDRLTALESVRDVESLVDVRSVRRLGKRRLFLMVLPAKDAEEERFQTARQHALEHPFVRGHLLSSDGRATAIAVALDLQLQKTQQLRPVVRQIREIVDETLKGTTFRSQLTGLPVIRVQNSDVVIQDQLIFNIAGTLAGLVVNLFLLRRPAAVTIVTAGAWASVFWTFGCFGLLGQPLSPVNGIVAPLAMTIALTDSIHLLLHIRRNRDEGMDRMSATTGAIREVGLACTLTSLTTIIGFLSLSVANLDILRNLGNCCALAVASAYVGAMTVVPLLATTRLGDHITVPNRQAATKQWSPVAWLAGQVLTYPRLVVFGGVVLTLVMLSFAVRLRTDMRISYSLPQSSRETLDYSDSVFRGTIPVILHVQWEQDADVTRDGIISALEDVHAVLEQSDIMSAPISLLSVLRLFPGDDDENLAARISELRYWPKEAIDLRNLAIDFEQRSMFVYLRCQDAGTASISADLDKFDSAFESLARKHSGFSFRMLDSTIMSARVAEQIVSDLMKALLVAIPTTLAIMAWFLRSIYFAMVGFLPNVFPMIALAACLVWFHQPLLLVGAVVFTISFGVAVDDTIHVLSNFKRSYARTKDVKAAILSVYERVGDALVYSTIILLAGMGVVMLSRTTMVRTFGAMFCIALVFALIADLVLLPAILACFPPRVDRSDDAEA